MEYVNNTQTPLGTKENPHPTTPPVKDRIKGHYYIYKNDVRYWNGSNLVNKEKKKKIQKKYRENNKEKEKAWSKKYREINKEKIKARQKKYRENNKEKENARKKKYREINKEKAKAWSKKYRENNKEKENARHKKYREINKEKIKVRQKEWRENNKEKEKARQKKYRENNKEKINEYIKKRRKNDPIFRLITNTRSRVRIALKQQNAPKNQRTQEYVNCSVAHLYYHIEQQFEDSMNWDNMGREDGEGGRGWELDHRRPCDSFDFNDEEQKYMCFHWTNLQPMWGQENNNKGDDYDPKTFRYKWIDRETGWVGIPKYLMNNN